MIEILKCFITLFVIINPIGNLTIFIGLSKGMDNRRIFKAVNDILFVACILLFSFIFFGEYIFNFFGIGLDSFQIGGGIVLLIIAITYLLGIHRRTQHDNDISIPMGTPLMIGPGTITSALILVNQYGTLATFMGAAMALTAIWIVLRYSSTIYRLMGTHWTMVASRIMGLILVAISVEFIKDGIAFFVKTNF
ncbi:MAG TPA: MarC family protein [Candidatus Nanoarchaeia archaeon]|nr:MarC family protein [Candidatus Nanoarchaeia archaeon]